MRSFYQAGAIALTLAAAFISPGIHAGDTSPVGLWKNIDDVSGKPRAIIRITESNGVLQGKIERVFPKPHENQNPTCEKCVGENRNTPVIGLVVLSGLVRNGDEYSGGQVLDPDSGSVYSSKIRVIEAGRKLSVRGYIGVPILGRTQTWVRQAGGK